MQKDLTPTSTNKSLKIGLKTGSLSVNGRELTHPKSEKEAFEGMPITQLMKENSEVTRAWLVGEVAKVCKFIDANKTLKSTDDFIFTVQSLYEYCKSWRAEEFIFFFDKIKKGEFGKNYERLKTAEFLEYARKYEEKRVHLWEQKATEENKAHTIDLEKNVEVVYQPQKKTLSHDLKNAISVKEYLSPMVDAGFLTLEEVERIEKQKP
jgi:hypothetical protein